MKYLQQLAAALIAHLSTGGRGSALVPIPVRTGGSTRRRERGASLVEYALLVALIALVCVGAVTLLGSSLNDQYSSVASSFD